MALFKWQYLLYLSFILETWQVSRCRWGDFKLWPCKFYEAHILYSLMYFVDLHFTDSKVTNLEIDFLCRHSWCWKISSPFLKAAFLKIWTLWILLCNLQTRSVEYQKNMLYGNTHGHTSSSSCNHGFFRPSRCN